MQPLANAKMSDFTIGEKRGGGGRGISCSRKRQGLSGVSDDPTTRNAFMYGVRGVKWDE